ncbi:MAG TPA: hypothetical protein VD962_06190, partial [Rubricoccaceae bacterium]|nr:hypothetical protein [Rubricoccaceae bacterium]
MQPVVRLPRLLFSPWLPALLALVAGTALGAAPAWAQSGDPLFLVNDQTTVSGLALAFDSTRTLDARMLKRQIATKAPGFLETGWRARLLSLLPLVGKPGVYPFNPVELQKDVTRL